MSWLLCLYPYFLKKCLYFFAHGIMDEKLPFNKWKWPDKTKGITSSTHEQIWKIISAKQLHELSFEVINTIIESGKPFSLKDISDKIREQWGIQRVSIWVTVRMYIETLENDWLIQFDVKLGKYRTTEPLEKTFKKPA